ncbi:hypothetical protein SNE40_022438 [Patella caerulea]|uniref:SAM-dependent MTase RsmB/NOP-type domain-containing protein n=1 Tax=Patella caerulea TaxID=87958 RepID=A0AAN8G5I1_PATCE
MALPALCMNHQTKELIAKSFCSNAERVENLMKWLGIPPSFTTLRVNTYHSSINDILQQVEITLKQQCVSRGVDMFDIWCHPALKDCLVIQNRGPKSTLIPVEKEVIVDLMCGMAVLRGADVFAQGIMGAASSMMKGDLVAVYCDMEGLCRRGATQKYSKNKMFVGNGVAQIGRDEYFCSEEKISGVGILMTQPVMEAPCLDILPNIVFAQNLPSIVCTHVLDPQPGETILDMCAAPGGKTTHIAALLCGKGRVVALDKARGKINKLKQNIEAWGLSHLVECYDYDARNAHSSNKSTVREGSPPYPTETFDRILLDGPCSALGQRPSLKNIMVPSVLNSFPRYQRQLMKTAVELLKPGGTLVYSTCTVPVEENEAQIEWALENFPQLKLIKQTPHVGGQGIKGGNNLSEDQLNLLQRFDPSILQSDSLTCDTDTIGFFIAKFIKSQT